MLRVLWEMVVLVVLEVVVVFVEEAHAWRGGFFGFKAQSRESSQAPTRRPLMDQWPGSLH